MSCGVTVVEQPLGVGRNGRFQVLRVLLNMGGKSLDFNALLNHTVIARAASWGMARGP